MIDRRDFLRLGSAALVGMASPRAGRGAGGLNAPAAPEGDKVSIGPATPYPRLHGDTWATTWADDAALYCAADDCFGLQSEPINSNLAVFRVTGGPPPDLRVETVNPMTEFGRLTEVRKEDGACWKASGIASIDGVLYLAVARNHYMAAPDFWIQESWDSSLVKSADHGKTWSAAPRLDHAMFPGRLFANPAFVQYGRDGQRPGSDDPYVYAISNDGTWNNGSAMILGRVRRDRIGRLEASDWEFVHGYDDTQTPIWRPRHDSALSVFRSPGKTGMCGLHFNAGLGVYLLPQWYYPLLDDPDRRWRVTRVTLYQAPQPWGPWTLLHEQEFEPQGYYNPVIPGKFISEDGRRFWIFAAGDFSGSGAHPYYTINMMPVTVRT
jgi:hypothetical protein